MILRQWMLALGLGLFVGSLAFGQTPPSAKSDPAPIDALIRKLGSSSFVQRELARKELEAIGTPALESLRRAKKSDVETTRRIETLIRLFEEQLLTRQILEPKFVHLHLENATTQDAIAELAKLSGYPLQFQGDATKIASKITLDTGKTSFWQAFDQLCKKAGLMERIDLSLASQPSTNTPFGIRRLPPPMPMNAPGAPIVMIPRGDEPLLASYAGAIKTQVHISRDAGTKELKLLLIVSAEPRLLNNNLVGRPVIDKILDEQSRKLETIFETEKAVEAKTLVEQNIRMGGLQRMQIIDMSMPMNMQQPPSRFAEIRVKNGERAAKLLKELAGKITVQLDRQNEVIAKVEKILEAAGKSAASSTGGSLKVQGVKRLGNGDYEVQVSMENLVPNPFGGNVVINGGNVIIRGNVNIQGMIIGPGGVQINGTGVSRSDLPDLLDAKGQRFKIASIHGESMNFVNGSSSRTATIVFQPSPGQTEPSELVLFGTRNHTIVVPFRFEGVPLP